MGPLLRALISIGLLLATMGGGWAEMLSAAAAAHVQGDGDGKEGPVHHIHYKYHLVEFDIGNGGFLAVLDTGSDLVWTKECPGLKPVSCLSDLQLQYCTTCKAGACNFEKAFGYSKKIAKGIIAKAKLTLSRRKNTDDTSGTDDETNDIYDVTMGCAYYNNLLPKSADGIVGLNRGPMSLVQQLSLTNFSYCFSDKQVRGRLWLGDGDSLDQLSAGPYWHRLQTTPLVDVERTEAFERLATEVDVTNMYYVQLEGISIGGNFTYQSLPKESFNLRSKKDKDKGVMFLDSGCSRTRLEKGVFEALLELLAHQHLGAEVEPEEKPKKHKESTCFRTSKEPEMALYFHGVQMHLPWANYTHQVQVDGKPNLFCLDILVDPARSILGNFLQQNTYMLYNLTKGNERLSFVQDFNCHPSP